VKNSIVSRKLSMRAGLDLKITTFTDEAANSNDNGIKNFRYLIEPPFRASLQEIAIHKLLDDEGAYMINVKEYLASLQRVDSPDIRKAFIEKN
jgi:hypothetical protein